MTRSGSGDMTFTNSWADYTYIWNVGTDLPNTEDDTVYARLKVNDGGKDSNQWAETVFTIDTKNPGAPSSLTDIGANSNSIDISWTKSSGDTNWYRYEIYCKDCDPCTITRGTAGESLKVVTDLNTESTTIESLNFDTTYTINIWAVDTFGHATPDSQITASTTDQNTITVTGYSLSETSSVVRGSSYAMFGFNLASSSIIANLYDVKVYFDTCSGNQSDISNVTLYEDDGDGIFDGGDTSVGSMSWNTSYYSMTTVDPDYSIAASPGTNFIMVVTLTSNVNVGRTFKFKFNNDDYVAVDSPDTVNSFTGFSGSTYTVSNWWHKDWQYRWPVTITNNTSLLTNHQVGEIVLNDDSPVDLHLFKTAGADARLANTSATEITNYWIQSWNTSQSKLWVNMPILLSSSNTVIYLYGGNSGASDSSNYSNTFTKISNNESGLVGLWHMDTGSGVTAYDSSINGNNGSMVNDVYWVGSDGGRWDGVSQQFSSGDHLKFNSYYTGNRNYVNCGDINALDRPDAITVEVWFNRTVDNAGTDYDTAHAINNILVAQSSAATNDNIEIGTEGTYVEMYIDSAGIDNFSYSAGILNNTWYHKGDFGGYMDEIAIYTRALTLEEIQAHYYRRKYANPQPYENGIGPQETQ
jgi:hypothetical protein